MLFNATSASGDSVRFKDAKFSRKWVSDEVPGIKRMLGERWCNQAKATCMGVVPKRSATSDKVEDCRGVKPPSGKNGT